MKRLHCIAGASGTGKSTLLNYVRENFHVNVTEVSARPYLPIDTDYVNGLSADSQILITQHRFVSFVEKIIDPLQTLFSRSPVDSLAYEMVLKKAPFMTSLLRRQIIATRPVINYLYVPIEFEMESKEDTIRGTNMKVQRQTDEAILAIFKEMKIEPLVIKGTKEERFEILDQLFEGRKCCE